MIKTGVFSQRAIPITSAAVEWPTVALITLNWLAFLALTLFYHTLPWWLILPLGGFLVALFGSLQHEVLHGHPTPDQTLNEAMIFPNIALWMPYSLYKSTHLTHHINDQLTDPELDPESYYLSPEKWQQSPSFIKTYYRFYNTFIGRFLWGPMHIMTSLWMTETRSILSGNTQTIRIWTIHLLACLPVLYWVVVVCSIPFWEYIVLFVYPGISLTLMRSFAEHQAVATVDERSIIVETNPLLSLMYLNNNLHAVHHKNPNLAWFRIPMIWECERDKVLADNGNYYFKGYFSIIRQYSITPKEPPNHPVQAHGSNWHQPSSR